MAAVTPQIPLGFAIADKNGRITTPWSFYLTNLSNTVNPVGGPVISFNGRGGAVVLENTDVYYALNYIPVDPAHANLTNVPTAPTAPLGTSSTQIATTAFIQNTIAALPAPTTVSTFALAFAAAHG